MPITWPDNYVDQRVTIIGLLNRRNALDSVISPATHINTNAPTEVDIDAAWMVKRGSPITAPDNSHTLWYDPSDEVIQNIYFKLPVIQAMHTPLHVLARNPEIVLLDSLFVDQGDTPIAFWDATIDPDYHNILIISNLASTQTVATALSIRPNNNAGPLYQSAEVRLNNTPVYIRLVAENVTSISRVIPGTNSERGLFTNVVLSLFWPFAPEINHARSGFTFTLTNINDLDAPSDVDFIFGGWSFNDVALAITSIRFDPPLNFDKGTWIYIFGVNPIG